MTTNVEKKGPAAGEVLPVVEQRGACVDFLDFSKEQYLTARAALTMIRVLHNPNWEAEYERIRQTMRAEVDRIFAPVEKSMSEGTNCREVLQQLMEALAKAEK